jgi:filamentous hemagglutinin
MKNIYSLKVAALFALPGALAIAFALRPGPAPAAGAQLPVPCIAGTCGTTTKWVGAGTATATQSANTLTVNQTSSSAILNWQSFNISANGTVTFKQPNASAIALNQIFQADPSKIMGALNANGGIYLINQNGIIFGAGSQVNVHTLLASSLNITPDAMTGLLNAAQNFKPALSSFTDQNGNPLPSGDISVQAGASIQAPGGQVMLFGPNVTNAGTIRADGGQVILAAGNQIYIAQSTDPNLRGLLVEVGGTGGIATNAAASGGAAGGQISANLGDVTMVGHIVNQLGRVSASTSVVESGSIHLLAEDGGQVSDLQAGTGIAQLTATRGGNLTLGPGSHTDVLLDTADTTTAVDATTQPQSQVVLHGTQVVLNSGSEITATHGLVTAVAANNPDDSVDNYTLQPGNGRLVIESGASIDVSGANIQEPVSDNIIAVQLRGTELENSPLQQNGPLRGQTVFVDVRTTGTLPDGTTWVGSPIGDLSGYAAAISRNVAERSLTGGKISLQSDGAVLAYAGSTLNESGGSIQFLGGQVNTTKLLGTDGKIYDISQALPNLTYVGAVNTVTVSNSKWGTSHTFQSSFGSQYEAGYVEGKDAGTISVAAPSVVLDGTLAANTVIGPNQRQLPTALPQISPPLYRPVNQIPLGGELQVGLPNGSVNAGFLVSDVTFAPGNVLDSLTGPGGAPFNPLTDPLPASLNQVQLNPALVGPNGVSQLQVFANGHVAIPEGVDLQFPIAGGLSVTAGSVDIEGSIRAPSGTVTVNVAPTATLLPGAPDLKLTLGSSAILDVSGYVVNDLPAGTTVPRTDPLAINGGSVTLNANGGAVLNLQSGSLIDVSGGAQLTSAGQVNAGSGGSIKLSAAPDTGFNPVQAIFDSTLRGFALQNGGSVNITANSICIAAADCTMGQVGALWVAPGLFTADGFSSVSLASNLGGLELMPGTTLSPRQLNYQLASVPSSELTGASLASFAPIALSPDLLRNPESVSLTTSVGGFANTVPSISANNVLSVGHGASINLDPKGSLTLASNTSVIIDGALNTPAGTITVSTTTTLPLTSFLPNQGIWLEDGAQLSAPGVALLQVNDQGLTIGSVLDAGSISITANRGYLITTPKSSIDASGAAATLDLMQTQANGNSSPVATLIGSSGGTVSLTASEGMLLNGAVTARAGAGPGAAGGTLNVTFDGSLHADPGTNGSQILPTNPHQLMISNSLPSVIVAPGFAVPDNLNGVAMLSAQTINGGGFVNVDLSVPNVFGPQPAGVQAPGSIVFPNSVTLNVPGTLRLNTPNIVGGPGAQVNLTSAYVGLGYDDTRFGAQAPTASVAGTGSLKANGDLIELIGGLALSGFQSTTLTSSGDIRLRGVEPQGSTAQPLAESLQTNGLLTLQAAQIYPTTLTQANVTVGGDNSEIDILKGGTGGPVFSAAGQLTLQADTISQGGVLVAPFGQITLKGTQLTLAPGSLTSTSGAGQTIPFGTTEAGVDWTYVLPQGQTLVYTTSGPPAKSISLQGNSVNVATGATIDVSGGGDMQAYEFIPGTTGTIDVLGYVPQTPMTQFAILPASGLMFAPYDPQAAMGFPYAIGSNPKGSNSEFTTVVLGAGNGVPAGTYAVLPARYALLPGAYLVTPVAGFANLAPGQTVPQTNGSVIVNGRFGQTGTNIVQPQSQGFDIESLTQVMAQAQYTLTSANAFFSAAATAANTQPPALPRDAGTLQFQAGQQLQFMGIFADAPAAGGRGGLVDISATQLEITNGASAGTVGVVTLDAAQLNTLNAQSLLIGGIRSPETSVTTNGITESVTNIQTTASSVTVDPNVKLTGSDLIVAATDNITVGSGATLQATGTAVSVPSEYDLTGGGALLRVSTGPQVSIVRSALDGAGGAMNLSAGSSLIASGSATLDASGNLTSAATYSVQHGSLAFSAPQITFGATTQSGNALNLSSSELSSLDLAALVLTSASSIDVYGANSLAITGDLALNTPVIDAATPASSLSLQANTVTLNGSSTVAPIPPPPTSTSSGNFTVQANSVALGGATLLQGFAATSLDGENDILAKTSGYLVSSGPLTLNTALLTGANAVNYQFSSGGATRILGPTGAATAPTNVAGAGATLGLSGSSIEIGTRVASASGTLQLTATGPNAADGVALDSGAAINLSGSAVTFDGTTVDGPGGRLLVNSAAGGFTEASGASIALSAGGPPGAAGTLSISVPQGTAAFLGSLAANGASGGDFLLDSLQLPDLGALNATLNAGGFGGARSFRQRGAGDVIVDGTLRASTVSIEADAGSVDVQGALDASGASGGTVSLYASNAVTVEGSIVASASQAGQNGGSLQIAAGNGQIQFANSAAVNLSAGAGGNNGSIALQVPRSSLITSGSPAIALGGSFRGVQQAQVEGLASYQSSGSITAADQAGYYADALAFMQNAAAIGQSVAGTSNLNVSVVPGVEVQSPGDLKVANAWDLSTWQFNGVTVPGILTLRAGGNLIFNASLSDGFSGTTGAGAFVLPSTPGPSWSYQLVAGADLGASDLMAVQPMSALASNEGNVMIAKGAVDGGANNRPPTPIMVRTGTGDIDIAAAGDLIFGNRASVIYTAGEASNLGVPLPGLQNLAYPTSGGNISINVGGDILGAPTNQLVTSWLWRTGGPGGLSGASATGWTVNYRWFEENVGALGGGNVSIAAGGDVSELSVAIPNVGVPSAATPGSSVSQIGGGTLTVSSGGNITGGSYFVGTGSANLFASGAVGGELPGPASHPLATGLAPILALGDAVMNVSAIDGLQIESAVNPFLLPQGRVQPVTGGATVFFSTYSGTSAVNLTSVAGDAMLLNDPASITPQLTSMLFNSGNASAPFNLYPGTLDITALAGNVIIGGSTPFTLWPAPRGNLNLLADLNVEFPSGASLLMSDVDPSTLPTPSAPVRVLNTNASWNTLFAAPVQGVSHLPIHSAAFGSDGSADPVPARVVALTGDVSNANLLYIAKPIDVIAGKDILELNLQEEQLSATDLSVISAGRNFTDATLRDADSGLQVADGSHGIIVEGPGSLLLSAGGNVNFGASAGITSAGNLFNPAIAAGTGADVTVMAGATVSQADIAAFTNQYLASESTYDPKLIAFVSAQTNQPITTKAQALQAFATLSQVQQFELSEQILFDELRTGGEAAAAAGSLHNNYTSAFTALSTLFPHSTSSDPATGAAATYPGSITMFFSRVYTLDGGNISLLAPGGFVNVGISTPPQSFGVAKTPDQLGIVAQTTGNVTSVSFGDFEVNESRVFAANGGNILVWSTDGNIDAGRGAKTAISAPTPTFTVSPDGEVQTTFPATLAGSGIQALATTPGTSPGNVDLFAPQGVVNANDAGIVAGNLTIGATAVLGRDNITVSGVAVGLPPDTSGLGASLASSSSAAASATSAAETLGASGANNAEKAAAPLSENALSWLDVFVTGLGEENCKPDDIDCLKRQKAH